MFMMLNLCAPPLSLSSVNVLYNISFYSTYHFRFNSFTSTLRLNTLVNVGCDVISFQLPRPLRQTVLRDLTVFTVLAASRSKCVNLEN